MEYWRPNNDRRQFAEYSFFKVDPAWRRLSKEEKDESKYELTRLLEKFTKVLPVVRTYSLVGIRGAVDFWVWLVADRLEDVQGFGARTNSIRVGAYICSPIHI